MQPTAAIPPAIAAVFASPPLRGDPDRATLDCDGGRRLRLLLDQAQPGESSSVASSSLTTWRSPEPRPETAPGARRARRLVSKLAAPPVGVVRTDMHNHTNERAKRLDHTFSHLASLGNFDVRADLSVSGTALWQCPNEDANTAPRQNKVLIGAPTSSTSFPACEIKNGNLSITTNPAVRPRHCVGETAGCPNPTGQGQPGAHSHEHHARHLVEHHARHLAAPGQRDLHVLGERPTERHGRAQLLRLEGHARAPLVGLLVSNRRRGRRGCGSPAR